MKQALARTTAGRLTKLSLFAGALVLSLSLLLSCSQNQSLKAERYALLIGISNYLYSSSEGFSDLDYPSSDAQALGELLKTGGWTVDSTSLIDYKATKKAIEEGIRDYFSSIPLGATVLIYYSGHGTDDGEGTAGFLVPSDYKSSIPSSLISLEELSDWIVRYIKPRSSNIIVIADSCNSGGFIGESDSLDLIANNFDPVTGNTVTTGAIAGLENLGTLLAKNFADSGALTPIVLSAAGVAEESWESSILQQGVFTYYLLESAHLGDSNGDGYVTCTEAYNYTARAIDEAWNNTGSRSTAFYPHMSGGLRDLVLFDLN